MPSNSPESIEMLPLRQQKLAHWILDMLAASAQPFGRYGFDSTGLTRLADLLVRLGLFTYRHSHYEITAAGNRKLQELTTQFGAPKYPRDDNPDSGPNNAIQPTRDSTAD